ncbi:MAG: hypothetical protein COW52_07070 [Nitrospirae bacterium CG17_big_fil_post_rev_8_21_14_2_50_50_9]|nr:MAG: hypothetical protein COW52_07070 [Nitrospirae bacterium CG17_big_fil_post_rev_8_21_14_2_50_50_9]
MKTKTIVVSALMIFLLLSGACGKKEETKVYSTPGGKVEVTKKQGGDVHEMTVKTGEGTTTMKMGADTIPKDLGVPVYPGVEAETGQSWSMTGMDKEKKNDFSATVLFSKDPIDKVSAFYKEKLKGDDPKIYEMAMPEGKMVNIIIDKQGSTTQIVLTENKEKKGTQIQITRSQKDEE